MFASMGPQSEDRGISCRSNYVSGSDPYRMGVGISVEEVAEALSVSPVTVARDWRMAKVWLRREIAPGLDSGSPIDFSYTPPFKFNGKLGKVTVELKP